MKYPKIHRRRRIEGKVLVQFFVEIDGSISEVQVIESLHPDYDEAAKEVIELFQTDKNTPKWIPATKNNRKIQAEVVIPIHFKKQKRKSGFH